MFDIVVVVVVVVVFFLGEDTKGSVVVTGSSSTTTMVARNNRWDNRVPFPHVHKMEMVEMSIPIPELTKLPRPAVVPAEEMDLANSRIMDEMTVNMTWDHQLIQEVRESVLEICRIKMVNLVVGTTVLPLLLLLSTTALDGILVARCSEW